MPGRGSEMLSPSWNATDRVCCRLVGVSGLASVFLVQGFNSVATAPARNGQLGLFSGSQPVASPNESPRPGSWISQNPSCCLTKSMKRRNAHSEGQRHG